MLVAIQVYNLLPKDIAKYLCHLSGFVEAEYIGLPYVSAYLDTINTYYRHGANFATSGSTIRSANSFISLGSTSPFYLQIQTTQYTQLKSRILDLWSSRHPKADKSQLQKPGDFSKALFTMDIGQNDLILGFFKLSKKEQRAAIPDIIDEFAISVKVIHIIICLL